MRGDWRLPMARAFHFLAFTAATTFAVPLAAQDAAETAIILSGTGQAQGKAQKSLGSSISRSMGNAANAVAAANRSRVQPSSVTTHPRRTRGGANFAIPLPADVDPLERTDAPSYVLGNGSTIRVSGGLRRAGVKAAEAPPKP